MKILVMLFCIVNFSLFADPTSDAYQEYKKGNLEKAVKLFTKACNEGNFKSCGTLGYMYHIGDGVVKNKKTAMTLYSKVCDSGDHMGCYSLARMYSNGDGVPKNIKKANETYFKACKAGSMISCNNLAINYYESKQTQEFAIRLFKIACEGGYSDGCSNYKLAIK